MQLKPMTVHGVTIPVSVQRAMIRAHKGNRFTAGDMAGWLAARWDWFGLPAPDEGDPGNEAATVNRVATRSTDRLLQKLRRSGYATLARREWLIDREPAEP